MSKYFRAFVCEIITGFVVEFDDLVKPGWADVREIDDDPELFASSDDIAAELGQAVARRSAGGKEPPSPAALRRTWVRESERRPSS